MKKKNEQQETPPLLSDEDEDILDRVWDAAAHAPGQAPVLVSNAAVPEKVFTLNGADVAFDGATWYSESGEALRAVLLMANTKPELSGDELFSFVLDAVGGVYEGA